MTMTDRSREAFARWKADHGEQYLLQLDDWSAEQGWNAARADMVEEVCRELESRKQPAVKHRRIAWNGAVDVAIAIIRAAGGKDD